MVKPIRTPEHIARVERALAMLDAAKRAKWKKAMVGAKANKMRRRREKDLANKAAPAARWSGIPTELRKVHAIAGWKVLLARMEPGTWYSFAEIRDLAPEYAAGSIHAWVYQRIRRQGLLERAGNPDYDPAVIPANAVNSVGRYLYRLADGATGKAAEWRLALGGCPGPEK